MKKLIPLIFLSGCLGKPNPLSWDTTINLPLASRQILVQDIIEDTLPPDSIALLKMEYTIDTTKVELTLDSLSQDTSLILRDIILNKRYTDILLYSLATLFPKLAPYHNSVVDTIPPFYISVIDTFVFSPEPFEVYVDSGYFHVGICNTLPIRIDSIHWLLMTPDTFRLSFINIRPNEYRSERKEILDNVFSNLTSYELEMWTHETTSVFIDTTSFLQVDGELFVKNVSKCIGKFPACTIDIEIPIPLDPFKVELIAIDSGKISLYFYNPIKCDFNLEVENNECSFLPFSLYTQEGANDTTVGFYNDTIKPLNPDSIRISTTFFTSGSAVFDTVDDRDTFEISVKLLGLHVGRIKGFIDSTITRPTPSYTRHIDYEFDPSPFVLNDVYLFYDIWSQVNATPKLNLFIKGMRNSDLRELNLSFSFSYGENEGRIGGDSVINFVNLWAESISVSGEVSIYGDVDISSDSCVWGEFGFMVPLDFTIKDTLVFEPDTAILIEVPEDVRENTILETRLRVYVLNTTPLSGSASLYLSPDSANMGAPVIRLNVEEGKHDYWQPVGLKELLKYNTLWAKMSAQLFPGTFRIFIRDKIILKTLLQIKTRVGG